MIAGGQMDKKFLQCGFGAFKRLFERADTGEESTTSAPHTIVKPHIPKLPSASYATGTCLFSGGCCSVRVAGAELDGDFGADETA